MSGTAQKLCNLISSGSLALPVFRAMGDISDQCQAEAAAGQVAQRRCDPSHAARSLEQAEGDIKTAVLLALGVGRVDAETILKNCDGNLRRVFAELAKDRDSHRDRHPKGVAARKQGGVVEP